MRLIGLHIKNFLSFTDFDWTVPSTRVSVIVGPNGSGKSNLFHAIHTVVDALDIDSSLGPSVFGPRFKRSKWEGAAHRGLGNDGFAIGMDIQLTSDWEKRALAALVGAALCDYPEIQRSVSNGLPGVNLTYEGAERFSQQILTMIHPDSLNFLVEGRLSAACDGVAGWSTFYESLPGAEQRFRWELEGWRGSRGLVVSPTQGGTIALFDAWRQVLAEADRNLLDSYFRQGASGDLPEFDLRQVLAGASNGLKLEVIGQPGMLMAGSRQLESLVGVRFEQVHTYGGRWLFDHLCRRSVVFTDNVRKTPKLTFPVSELESLLPLDLSNGEDLALDLFRKKNGDRAARKRYLAARALFRRFTGRQFDVGWAPSGLSAPNEQPTAELKLRTINSFGDIPLEFSGAGIADALYLSTLIEGTEDCIVLLDEPALALHPPTQVRVLKEIQSRARSQFVVVTHSPMMVPATAIEHVTRFHLQDGSTRWAAPKWTELDPRKAYSIRHEFGTTADMRPLLFSRGVILIEGPAEITALPLWYEKKYGVPPEESDLMFYWVNGYQNFGKNASLLSGFEVPWVIVFDGGAITSVAVQLERVGLPNAPDLKVLDTTRDFEECRVRLSRCGAFTLAGSPSESFETFLTRYETLAPPEVKGNVSLARWAADNHDCPAEVSDLFDQIEDFLRKLQRNP